MKELRGQKISIGIISLVFVFFLYAGVSLAQQDPRLDLKTTAEKEVKVKKNGKLAVERVPVVKTAKGDVLVYTITYLNVGKTPAIDAEVVDPIPREVSIITESVEGKDTEIQGSIDNGRTWQKLPVMMELKKPDGKTEVKAAPPERYSHIKWIVKKPIQSGQSGKVSFKVKVK